MDAYFSYDQTAHESRTLAFERIDALGDLQGNPVIHYRQESAPHARITEGKPFAPWEDHTATVALGGYGRLADPDGALHAPLQLETDQTPPKRYGGAW